RHGGRAAPAGGALRGVGAVGRRPDAGDRPQAPRAARSAGVDRSGAAGDGRVIAVDLPVHLYGYVDRAYLSQHTERGWEPAIWFGITVPRNRAIGLTVLLECGAQYRELPSHAWAFDPDAPAWTLEAAQAWDCFGGTAQIVRYTYLQDLSARLIRPPKLT